MKKFSEFLTLRERCWPGYKSVPGKKAYSPGSCVKEEWSQKYKSSIDCNNPKGFSQKAHCAGKKKKLKEIREQHREKGRFHPVKPYNVPNVANASTRPTSDSANVKLKEDLRKWFSKTDPSGDWKRINSKGEAIGPCAREPGEPKPKCMSKAKRASLSKKERASAVRAKRKHDPNPERQGKPINVSNFGKGKISEDMENLDEKNVPAKEKTVMVRHKTSGKELVVTVSKAKELQKHDYHPVKEEVEQHKEIYVHTEVEDGSHQDKNDTKNLHDRVKAAAKKHGATITYQDRPSLRGSHSIAARGSHDFHKEVKHIASDYEHLGAQHEVFESVEQIDEKNVPTSPEKWAQAKAQAKAKFDVYPSAYANGWAAKKYKAMGGGWKSVSEAVKDKFDIGEYDQEGDMAKSDLRSIIANAKRVHDMLEDSDNLPEWVQSKITKAEDYMSTVANYMASEMSEETDAIGLVKPKTGLTAAAKTLAPATRVAEESKPPFDKPYTTVKGTVTDKSGAKHTPMSRARDLARKALQDIKNKQPKAVKESLDESRRMEIVREAMKVAKKKKETIVSDDKYQPDPMLSSQITKT